MATPTYELIETTTLSSSASSVTFSSITQDYRDLVLVFDGSQSNSVAIRVEFNGDTTSSNYHYVEMLARAIGGVSSSSANLEFWAFVSTGQTQITMQLMDYSATDKHKTALLRWGEAVDSQRVAAVAGRWADTSAITSLKLDARTETFTAGSTFSIYGIASEVV